MRSCFGQTPLDGKPLSSESLLAADIQTPIPLVRDLIRAQHPSFAHLALAEGDCGWDNNIYRLGDDLAVRLPIVDSFMVVVTPGVRRVPPGK